MFEQELAKIRDKYIRSCSERDLLVNDRNKVVMSISAAETDITTYKKVLIFLQDLAASKRERAKVEIEKSVTSALRYVFGQHYSFKIILRPQNARPEADFLVVTTRGDKVITSTPTLSKGGGIVDLLSVALKFAMIELLDYDGPLWLDEPFKQISEAFIEDAGKLLTFMGETSGRQIILITHNQSLMRMCSKGFVVGLANGESIIRTKSST